MKYKVDGYFMRGFAKTLDISGTKEWPDISDDKRKDFLALRSDWENVGNTIRESIIDYDNDYARR